MAKSNPVDETRIADPVERTKRQRHSNAKKAAGTAKAPKQQRRRKSAIGSRNGTKPASGRQSKQQTCLDLGRREGATIEDLEEATGWQKHSVRGFLTGAVKKKLGLTHSYRRSPMRGPAAIAFRPRPERHGPECVGGAQRAPNARW